MPPLLSAAADPDRAEAPIGEAMKYDKMVMAESMQKLAHPAVATYLLDTKTNHAKPDPVGQKYANWTYMNYMLGFGHPAERATRDVYEQAARRVPLDTPPHFAKSAFDRFVESIPVVEPVKEAAAKRQGKTTFSNAGRLRKYKKPTKDWLAAADSIDDPDFPKDEYKGMISDNED